MTRISRITGFTVLITGFAIVTPPAILPASAGAKSVKIVASFGREVLVELAADGVADGIKGLYKSLKQKWKKGIDPKKVMVDADDPLRGTLQGEVTVRVEQNGKTLSKVVLRNPPVSRTSTKAKWQLAPKELDDWEKLLDAKSK
jgi:hypothetical protein